ncbi:hypothetical protein [Naasia sp. SYSU D00057]|uniref:hypothetical protein n=1 Tax=Naasia sp. SYSU D00057 TaxID=2817380 RepID=UPI001B3118FF|nr:hypothetical protein [Naasia sp. SYSU D00057]
MRKISYADEHFVTSDAIAERVLQYAKLMGRQATDDVVSLPAVDEDGSIFRVEVLIGPASQITAVEMRHREADLPDEAEVVADLDARIAALRPAGPVVAEGSVDPGTSLDPDYL